jgi:hypothetical protein
MRAGGLWFKANSGKKISRPITGYGRVRIGRVAVPGQPAQKLMNK